jgi:hypothetical protein
MPESMAFLFIPINPKNALTRKHAGIPKAFGAEFVYL